MQNLSRLSSRIGRSFQASLPSASSTRLTISLGGNSLKVAAVGSKGVKAWSVIPFNPRFVRDGVITDPKAFSQVILNAIDRPGLRLFRALGALSGQRSIVSTLALPKVGDISLNELIPREARRSIGVATDTYYLHWRPLRKEASQQVFYLVAVPRDAVDRFVESMRLAGLKLSRLELAGMALARTVDADTAIMMNVESDLVDLVIMVDKVPLVVHTRSLEEIAPMGQDLSLVMVEELRQIIDNYNDRNPTSPLGLDVPVYVSGPLGSGEGLKQQIHGSITTEVREMKFPRMALPDDFPLGSFAVNLGLTTKR